MGYTLNVKESIVIYRLPKKLMVNRAHVPTIHVVILILKLVFKHKSVENFAGVYRLVILRCVDINASLCEFNNRMH